MGRFAPRERIDLGGVNSPARAFGAWGGARPGVPSRTGAREAYLFATSLQSLTSTYNRVVFGR